jgi:nitroreductase
MSEQFLKVIKSRRVIRVMTDKQVDREVLEKILETARWAPAAGNQRTNRFVVVQDPVTLRLIRKFSPGMFQKPQAVILICLDWNVVNANKFSETDTAPYMDVGATMQTIMLAAHGIGLGSGPVTSFSKEALRVILNLPDNLSPEMLICIGYAAPPSKAQLPMLKKKKVTWQSLTHWERYKVNF